MNWVRRSHSRPATTLQEQSHHLKLCTAAEQVKEKQVKVFQVLRTVQMEKGRKRDRET